MALTVKGLGQITDPGRYGDGAGLYVQVLPTGGRSWLMRYKFKKKERWLGLGSLREFTLDEARERARKSRQLLRDGVDPIEDRKAKRAAQALDDAKHITFADAAKKYSEAHEDAWTNAKHRQQFMTTMRQHVFPIIGGLPVAAIDTGLILRVVEPMWPGLRPTAIRVRGRIEKVLDWAAVRGYRTGDNPARWRGHLSEVLPVGKKAQVAHHAALPYADMPEFIADLNASGYIGVQALEFLVLTAARTNEVIGARWSEFDLEQKVWTVPGARMKGRVEHSVPLSDRAVQILHAQPRTGGFVFGGSREGKPLGHMVLIQLIKSMRYDTTVHGFRSTFRDFSAEQTNFSREVCEAALAHQVGNKTEQAYKRTKLLEKRRLLMEATTTNNNLAQIFPGIVAATPATHRHCPATLATAQALQGTQLVARVWVETDPMRSEILARGP